MSDDVAGLLTALDIAAFERNFDGSFRPTAPMPAWFAHLGQDGTFPFLGHILEEAHAFWATADDGVRVWGPCADTADDGTEFHYVVKAVRIAGRAFLVFQIDEGAEQIREVLQKVRSEALDADGSRKTTRPR